MSWADDLIRLSDKGGHDLHRLARAIKIELFTGVVSDTRVDTGRLRGNWQIQENHKAQGAIDRLDKTGSGVTSEVIKKASSDGLTFFTNNLPYAKRWENTDGMIGRNVARLREIVRQEAAK